MCISWGFFLVPLYGHRLGTHVVCTCPLCTVLVVKHPMLAHLRDLPYSQAAPLSWSWDFTNVTHWKFNGFSPEVSLRIAMSSMPSMSCMLPSMKCLLCLECLLNLLMLSSRKSVSSICCLCLLCCSLRLHCLLCCFACSPMTLGCQQCQPAFLDFIETNPSTCLFRWAKSFPGYKQCPSPPRPKLVRRNISPHQFPIGTYQPVELGNCAGKMGRTDFFPRSYMDGLNLW